MQQPPSPSPVKPNVDGGGRHVLAWDDVRLEIDAATGGRVTALRLGDRNLLSEPVADAGNYGSTFWPSPQTAWGWPPVAEIDHGPYRAELSPDAIAMRSAISPALGLVVEKRFAADAGRAAVTFDFTMHNRGDAATRLAPWQITRVPPHGLTLFPTGAGDDPPCAPSNLAVREALGVTWYAYDAAAGRGVDLETNVVPREHVPPALHGRLHRARRGKRAHSSLLLGSPVTVDGKAN